MSTTDPVPVFLTADEALVLHELLQRFSITGSLLLEDQAEERALWNLCCLLESRLAEPFSGSYAEALQAARKRLRDPEAG